MSRKLPPPSPVWPRPLLDRIDVLQAENEALHARVTELDAAITAYMLGNIDGGAVSRIQHRQWFSRR